MATVVTCGFGGPTRNYSTFNSAAAAWVSGGYEIDFFNDTPGTPFGVSSIDLSVFATNATDFYTMTTGALQSFADSTSNPLQYNATNGAAISLNGYGVLVRWCSYFTSTKLQWQAINQAAAFCDGSFPVFVLVNGNIFESDGTFLNGRGFKPQSNWTFTNNLCVTTSASGGQNWWGDIHTVPNVFIVNNTFALNPAAANAGAACIDRMDYNNQVLQNNAVFGFSAVLTTNSFVNASNTATDNATAPSGTGNQVSASYSAQFVSTNFGTGYNFKLKSGAGQVCIDNGITETTYIPGATDIFGTSRPQGSAWDIGCNEFFTASAAMPFMNGAFVNPQRAPVQLIQPIRPDGSPTTLTELFPQLMPFRQRDWQNPQIVASRNVAILSQPKSVLVLTTLKGKDQFFGAPGEVLDYHWPNPQGPPPRLGAMSSQPMGKIPSLLLAPFSQTNWPNPIGPQPRTQTQPLGQNPNFILPNGIEPFNLGDQPNPLRPPPPTQTQPLGSFGALLASIAAPFYQTDWPNPRAPQAPTQTQPLGQPPNFILPTGFKPFSMDDWPVPPGPRQPVQTQPLGTWRNLTPLPPAPFFQSDWQNPPSGPQPRTQTQPLGTPAILTLLAGQDALPFRQADWPIPRAPQPAVQTQPLGTFQGVFSAAPFFQTAWPVPRGPQLPVQTQPQGSFWPLVVGVPFSQSDWPNPRAPQQPTQTQLLGSYVGLVGVGRPFSQKEWPNPRGPQPVLQTQPIGSTIAFYPPAFVPAPFFQTDWPNPRGPEPRTQTQPLGCAHPTVHPNRLIFNALYLATAAPSYLVSAPDAPYLAIYPGEE